MSGVYCQWPGRDIESAWAFARRSARARHAKASRWVDPGNMSFVIASSVWCQRKSAIDPRQFAAALRRWRRGHRLTQRQACAELGLPDDQALICDYELGNAVFLISRLPGLIEVLVSTFGTARKLTLDDIADFRGEAGAVKPWDLTDAIDGQDSARALQMLRRMLHGNEMHPHQVLAVLHTHYAKLLRLDGVDDLSPMDAAARIGSDRKSTRLNSSHRT